MITKPLVAYTLAILITLLAATSLRAFSDASVPAHIGLTGIWIAIAMTSCVLMILDRRG